MALVKCVDGISATFKISREKAAKIVEDIQGIKSQNPDPSVYQKIVQDYIKNTGYNLTKDAIREVQRTTKVVDILDRVLDPSFKGDAKQALLSAIEGTASAAKGSGRSVESLVQRNKVKHIDGLYHALAQEGLSPAFQEDGMFKPVVRALLGGKAESPLVEKLAAIGRNTFDNVWADSVNSGLNVGRLENYVPVSHDADAISQVSFDEWAKFTMTKIDNKKMFAHIDQSAFYEAVQAFKNGVEPSELLKVKGTRENPGKGGNAWINELYSDYKTFSMQAGKNAISDYSSILDIPIDKEIGNYARKVEKSRSYHWKSPDAFLEYNDRFGRNKTLPELFSGYLYKMTREMATVEMLGHQPAETINEVLSAANEMGYFKDSSIKQARIDALTSLEMANGSFYREINKTSIHRTGKAARQLMGFSQLGMSAFSNLMDLPSMILNNWSRGGDNVVMAVVNGVHDYISSAVDVLTKEARSDAALSMAESILEETNSFLLGSEGLRGEDGIGKALNKYLTWTGMKYMNKVSTTANYKTVMRALSKSKLDDLLLKDLARYNIDEAMVKHVMSILPEYNFNLHMMVNSADDKVAKLFSKNHLGLSELQYRNEVFNRFNSYLYDFVTYGSPKPGVTEARKLAFNAVPGTYMYEAALTLSQYKGINLKQIRSMLLASRLRGGTGLEAFKVLGTYAAIGTTFSGSVMGIKKYVQSGYDVDATYNYITENPFNFFGKSLARSNAAAFVGEMFINKDGELVNDMSELMTQATGAPSLMVLGNIGLKGVGYGVEEVKGLAGEGNQHRALKSFVDAVGRGTPLRNHPARYVPVIEQTIQEGYQMLIDLR